MVEHWVLVRESDPVMSQVPSGRRVGTHESLVVGREGDLPLGVDVVDTGISRRAVTVTPVDDGWRIETANRNGAVIAPWGLAPYLAQPTQLVRWPLVGVRVAGSTPRVEHWVLLESDGFGDERPAVQGDGLTTVFEAPPASIAPAERSALEAVFADHLAWPPLTTAPVPRQLKQVASRLGKSLSGVQDRLRSVQDKALRLGFAHPTTLTNPDYFHVLVAAGYLAAPTARPYRVERPGPGGSRTSPAGHPATRQG